MGIDLFLHNQAAYRAAIKMMEHEGKAAVIYPTGTGKSMIAFKLAEERPDSRILWLAPSSYIYKTQLENLNRGLCGQKAAIGNIRYLDSARDMAEELFDGKVASEMTLGEAIVKHILPAPLYVLSLYSWQEELKKWSVRRGWIRCLPAI